MNNLADEMAAKIELTDQQLDIIIEKKQRAGRHGRPVLMIAICVGIAAALAWQSYGDAIKQITARAPELVWLPQAKQMIASWTPGWTKPPASPKKIAPEAVAPKAPPAPSLDPAQVTTQSLPVLRETMGQIAADQHQTSRGIARRRRHRHPR
jgi:hypothetical protein